MSTDARRVRMARWLREQRHAHNLSVLELSQRLSIDVTTIYNTERAIPVQMPRFNLLDRWLLALGVDLLDLLGAVE